MQKTLKMTGYVGGPHTAVQQLLDADLAGYVGPAARARNGHIELEMPGSPLNRAELTTSPIGPESARLTEVALRLAQPFQDSSKNAQMLEASRLIGTTTLRLSARLAAAA